MLILSILPLNIIVITSTAASIDVIKEQTRIFMENTANYYLQKLDNRIFSINYFCYNLYNHDADFIRMTELRGDDEYAISQTIVAQKLRTNIETSDSADGYFFEAKEVGDSLFVLPGSRLTGDSNTARKARRELEEWLRSSDLSELGRWSLKQIGGRQWLLRVYSNDGYFFGAIISADEICGDVTESFEYTGLKINARMGQTGVAEEEGYLSVSGVSDRIDLTLSLSVPESKVVQTLPRPQWLMIVAALLYILLIPMIILLLNRILLRPLRIIWRALMRLKEGDRDYRISMRHYSKEFRTIHQLFNDMADSIENLKIKNYEKEMERQKMENRNLQLQIHPHFLLNMFKLVHCFAQLREYESIQKLALYLSNYFRYIFRSERELEEFEQEYNLIREYIEISALRYPGRFAVHYNVDASVPRVKIPPLIIHNFIENIMKHAMDGDNTVHIQLSAGLKEGWVTFIISDDGAGMDPEMAAQINGGAFTSKNGGLAHLGIYNIYQRIKHFYGEKSTIRVESEHGKGTRFTVRFPYDSREVGTD